MCQLLDSETDADLTCQSGTRWEDINRILEDKGIPLFFPVRSSMTFAIPILNEVGSLTLAQVR
jgi:hypothetical protein